MSWRSLQEFDRAKVTAELETDEQEEERDQHADGMRAQMMERDQRESSDCVTGEAN